MLILREPHKELQLTHGREGWRDFLAGFGAVDGTRENCAALMREGESILVYPGGAREVFKRKSEK